MYFQYTNLFSQIYNPLNSTKYNPGRWFLSSVRMHACVWVCVCVCVRACTHAAGGSGNPPHVFKHKPGLLLPSLWSKPCSDGDPTLEDCDFLAHETHLRRGRGGGALPRRQGHTPPSTGQDGTGQNGTLPWSWHRYCSREWPAVEFKCKETPFSPLQTPLWHSRTVLHATYGPWSDLRSRGLPGLAGRHVSSQQASSSPSPMRP